MFTQLRDDSSNQAECKHFSCAIGGSRSSCGYRGSIASAICNCGRGRSVSKQVRNNMPASNVTVIHIVFFSSFCLRLRLKLRG